MTVGFGGACAGADFDDVETGFVEEEVKRERGKGS